MKNIPQRTCIGCNVKKDKRDFIRIEKDSNDNISIDKTGKANGRGAYICDNIECLEKAIKNKKIEKSFKMNIDNEVYESLRKLLNEKQDA